MKNFIKTGLIFIICGFYFSDKVYAQADEYLMKAVALEQLSRFIEWPDDVWDNNPEKPFIIKVLGENPFGNKLKLAYSNYTIKNRPVQIEYIKELDDTQNCNLLFVSASEKQNLNKIVAFLKGKPVLTVGDTKGYAEKGIFANFYVADNKIRFEINEKGMEDAGLKVSFLLIKVAKIVNPKDG